MDLSLSLLSVIVHAPCSCQEARQARLTGAPPITLSELQEAAKQLGWVVPPDAPEPAFKVK